MGIIVVTNILGSLETNCYTLVNDDTREAIIIDPAANAKYLIDMIKSQNYILKGLFLTHGHIDHIGAIKDLKNEYPDVKIYCSEDEKETLENSSNNLSTMLGGKVEHTPDITLTDNEVINIIGTEIKCIKTPGHTAGGMCYYLEKEKMLFSGDTLFEGSIGRSDFPTGSAIVLIRSIREKVFVLPEDVKVYTGHGNSTTILEEKKYNPFAGEEI